MKCLKHLIRQSVNKAIYKAMTGAFKYALRQTFIIETGDDPDKTPSTELEGKEPAKKRAAAKAGSADRKENQWEPDILDAAVDLGLAQAVPHAVNRLNRSVFMDTPYGQLDKTDAIAFLMAWEYSQEKYPDDNADKRASRVNEGWTKFTKKAVELLGGEQA